MIFDFVSLISGNRIFSEIAYWMVLSGLTAGAGAAILGLVDWMMLQRGSRAKRRAFVHLVAYTCVLLIYTASAYSRNNDPSRPEIAATLLATFGSGIALFGAMLGAELAGKREEHERRVFDKASIVSIARGSDRS